MESGKPYTKWLKSTGSDLPGHASPPPRSSKGEVLSLTGFLPHPTKLSAGGQALQELARELEKDILETWDARFEKLNRTRKSDLTDLLKTRPKAQVIEEIATLWIIKSILCMRWDRKIGKRLGLPENPLSDIHYWFHSVLQSQIPVLKDGWNLSRQSLYSWWDRPASQALLEKAHFVILGVIEHEESPVLIDELFSLHRGALDTRFLSTFFQWAENTRETRASKDGFTQVQVFSPTLRNGLATRSSFPHWVWYGCENSLFSLFCAEAHALWERPTEAPLWCQGTGLATWDLKQTEASFLSSPGIKTESALAEMSAFDVAWVNEEDVLPTHQRSVESTRIRKEADQSPALRALREGGASLGMLQAALSAQKLRPGGILLWARNEALGKGIGQPVLGFLLGQAKLLCEWDFSSIQHSLPGVSSPFPKRVYAFQREFDLGVIRSHHPIRVVMKGSLRSHVEVPQLLGDGVDSFQKESAPRAQWQALRLTSPVEQREWVTSWPEDLDLHAMEKLTAIKRDGKALGEMGEVRCGETLLLDRSPFQQAIFLHVSPIDGSLQAAPTRPKEGVQFLRITLPDSARLGALQCYLRSDPVRAWLTTALKKKKDRWILDGKAFQLLPVPRQLFSTPLLEEDFASDPWQKHLHTARISWNIEQELERLKTLTTEAGAFRWKAILGFLPPGDRVPLLPHHYIQRRGDFPPYRVVTEVVEIPGASERTLQFFSEKNFSVALSFRDPLLAEIALEQIRSLKHPTWGEILREIELPRDPENLKATSAHLLQTRAKLEAQLLSLQVTLSQEKPY